LDKVVGQVPRFIEVGRPAEKTAFLLTKLYGDIL